MGLLSNNPLQKGTAKMTTLNNEFKRAKSTQGRKDWGPTGVSFYNQMVLSAKGIMFKFRGVFYSGLSHTWDFRTECTWYKVS
jgi:hypothetical protein